MESLVLLSAALLGILAFFEPCTIATHTLFAARAHQAGVKDRLKALFALYLSRATLSVVLLTAAVAIFERPRWSPATPAIILLVIAAVYVISRYSYIPIPHVDFSRLLPPGLKSRNAVQLGLTLPACTIPLFIIVAGMSVIVDSVTFAIIAGLIYSAMFTLPTAVTMFRGVPVKTRELFDHAARITPFVTAGLLACATLVYVIVRLDLSTSSVKTILAEPSIAGIALGFIVGLVFSFNPVSFAAIPVILAYVTKAHERKRAMMMGVAFVLGMVVIHVILGVGAAFGGEWVKSIMGRFWGVILGPVLIVLGIMWPGWLKIRLPWFSMKGRSVVSLWGAFLLGIPFSIAICPFCSPALVVMLAASAAIGSVSFGFFLLLAFALGRGIPVMIGAWSVGWLESIRGYTRYQKMFETAAGIVLILSGLYMLNGYFFILSL